jgi:hypothetical protein
LLLGLGGREQEAYAFLAGRGVNAPAGSFYALEASRRLGLGGMGVAHVPDLDDFVRGCAVLCDAETIISRMARSQALITLTGLRIHDPTSIQREASLAPVNRFASCKLKINICSKISGILEAGAERCQTLRANLLDASSPQKRRLGASRCWPFSISVFS